MEVCVLCGGRIESKHLIGSRLASNPNSVRSPVVIPNELLTSGYSYSLEVKLCNFLDACGWKVRSFVVSSSTNVPIVLLNTGDAISIFRNTSLSITGDAYLTVCGGGKSKGYLSFSWLLSQNNVIFSSPDMQSVSVSPREFKLSSFLLSVGSLYTLTLTVQHLKSMKYSSASVDIFIKSGDLMCALVGGDELGLRVDGSLVLDMSRSYDSNVDPNANSMVQPLSFDLQCSQIAPSYRDTCPSLIFSSASGSAQSKFVVIANSSLAVVGAVYQIVMTGRSSQSAGDFRSCEKAIRISILASLSPVVRLEVLSGAKMNPSSKLKISGSVDMGSSGHGEVKWSVDDNSIVLSAITLSPLTRSLLSSQSNSPHVMNLVVIGNSLPSQSSFLFTLSCSLANGYSSSSSVIIKTNSPPVGGVLVVSPPVGGMFETLFLLSSMDWVDEDLPLSYQFGYLASSSTSASTSTSLSSSSGVTVFRSNLQLSSASTLLPSGFFSNGSLANLTCVVIAFDQLQSTSRALFGVLVKEVKMSTDDLSVFLSNGVNSSQVNNDSDSLKSTLSSTAEVLNRVNCSKSPDCVSLNRKECRFIEGTCGECMSGYFGLLGSSNSPCLSSSQHGNHRTLISTPSSSSVCHSDVDCPDGLFLECNLQTHLCQSLQQTCPNSCSGHGRCVYKSKYDLNQTVDECGLMDRSCVSRCECDSGFMGSSCSVSEKEFLKQADLRHLLLEHMNELMRMENVEASNVKSWMKILSSVSSSDYLSLSEDSKILMSRLVIDILRSSASVDLSIEDLRDCGMDEVVDMCVSGLSSSLTNSSRDPRYILLMSLLRGYSDFLITDMSEDQYPISTVNPFYRSSSLSLSASSLSSTSYSLPQSDLESLGSFTQHSISLPVGLALPLQMSLSETLVQSNSDTGSSDQIIPSRRLSSSAVGSDTQLSLPLFISLVSPSCTSGDCVMRVTLQHKLNSKSNASLFVDTNSTAAYFETDCAIGLVSDHKFLCPSGDDLVISCNGTIAGHLRRRCPTRSFVKQCESSVQIYSSSSVISRNVSCLVSPSESNDSMTTCLCDLSTLGSMSDTGGTVSFSLLSIEKSVVKDFVSTWESTPSLSARQVADSWVVLVTVGGVGLSFLLLVLLSIQSDKYESRLVSSIDIEAKQKPKSIGHVVSQERALIEEALPSIFKSDSLWLKFKEEMRVYHRWLGIVFYYSPEFPRAMRVLSLFSSIVIMLFVQSVTYNIADPDDGSCEKCHTASSCLSLRSTLNGNQDRCYWMSSGGSVANSTGSVGDQSQGSCHFREIGEDMTRMFIVAVISAIISAPLALSVQYLIMNVLSKESVSEEEIEKERQRLQSKRLERLKSTSPLSSSELVEECGRSLLEDLNNLLKELSSYYKVLVGRNRGNEAQEFRDAWGSLVHVSLSDNPLKLSTRLAQCCSHISPSAVAVQHEDVTADLVTELGKVRQEVYREYQRLEGLGNMEGPHSQVMLKKKRKRLLYLFVKDLSRGLSGGVLSSKSQRDSQISRAGSVSTKLDGVSWEQKLTAGLFLTLLNGGMLLYVYLFAMSQTFSRQQAWFFSFVLWLGFEIFLSSTALVLVLHLLIPLYVWSDVSEVKKRVLKDLMKFRNKALKRNENDLETGAAGTWGRRETDYLIDDGGGFNAAKYLFPSWRVASLFPDLPESQFVVRFSTPWPKKKFGKAEGNVAEEYEDDVIASASWNIVVYFLTSLLHYSSLVQDIFIQTVCNGLLGYLCVQMVQLWRVYPWLMGLMIFAVGIFVYCVGRLTLNSLAKKLKESDEVVDVPEILDKPEQPLPSLSSANGLLTPPALPLPIVAPSSLTSNANENANANANPLISPMESGDSVSNPSDEDDEEDEALSAWDLSLWESDTSSTLPSIGGFVVADSSGISESSSSSSGAFSVVVKDLYESESEDEFEEDEMVLELSNSEAEVSQSEAEESSQGSSTV